MAFGLEPCPLCGSEAWISKIEHCPYGFEDFYGRPQYTEHFYYAYCLSSKCGIVTPRVAKREDHAVELWNKKVAVLREHDPIKKEILRKEFDNYVEVLKKYTEH